MMSIAPSGLHCAPHGRRRVAHFNVTFQPTSAWVIQQLRESFPYDSAPRYLIFDRDTIFNPAVVNAVRAMGIKPRRIAYRSPWQNGVAERWIGSCRREPPVTSAVLFSNSLLLIH